MKNKLSRRLFAVAAGCACAAGAGSVRCAVCGVRLGEKSWIYEGKSCCSKACVDKLRPICCVCGNIIRGDYRMADGKIYCSKACFLAMLPKCEICNKPVEEGYTILGHLYCKSCKEDCPACFSCGLPAAHPVRLADGREICATCMRWAVVSQEMAQRHYARARRQLEAWTSLRIGTLPELELVDRNEMRKLSKNLRKTDSPVSVRGLYSRQTMLKKQGLFGIWKKAPELDRETIYIVDHLIDEVFRVAATHELMHDLIHEHFQRLEDAPLWVHEGICQQAAADLCRRRGYADTLRNIEECTDPDYGDGYRHIKRLVGYGGWRALRRWMETADVARLPKSAPK